MSWFLAPHPNEQKSLAGDPVAPQSPASPVSDSPSSHPESRGTPTGPRVGLTAGKVLGKAHERNRIKRRMKEALRRHLDLLPPGCDLILHPRRIVLTMDFKKLEAEIVRILQQAKIEAARMTQNSTPPGTQQAL
jgi:ribonuclease P protein component